MRAVLLLFFLMGGMCTAVALANPEELCKKWPNNRQCTPTTTTPTPPPTTTGPPPTTTDEEPPPPPTTTTPEPSPPPSTPPNSPPPTTDLPHTGASWFWYAGFAAFLITVGAALLLFGRKPDA